ncbi:hypothetical protein PROFUN_13649 [Planoprotostelium fungivorum]|uniref:Uncharacterized protein n=1 Tax=Planoprotostelium fungivorum TaxID=1890364 RepID=A0A2P6N3G1_9EUKA|nr:hypothetical protein PROFUN_13649 [Planoprotostelium fungivorum]
MSHLKNYKTDETSPPDASHTSLKLATASEEAEDTSKISNKAHVCLAAIMLALPEI